MPAPAQNANTNQPDASIAASRLTGWLARRFGQPQVVGERIAGVLPGPSLPGWLSPNIETAKATKHPWGWVP